MTVSVRGCCELNTDTLSCLGCYMKVFKHHWCMFCLLKIQFQNTRFCHEITN